MFEKCERTLRPSRPPIQAGLSGSCRVSDEKSWKSLGESSRESTQKKGRRFSIRGRTLLKFSSWAQAPPVILLCFCWRSLRCAMLMKTLVPVWEKGESIRRRGSNTCEPLDGTFEVQEVKDEILFFFRLSSACTSAGCTTCQISQKFGLCTTRGLWNVYRCLHGLKQRRMYLCALVVA